MLTKADDYPIHQTPEPIAYSGSDRNFYDRYFFNGYAKDGEHFFAAAMGVYPHLNVIDGAFSLSDGERQHNVHASGCLRMERLDTRVGPIAVDVVEPLQKLRLRIDDRESGIRADLLFDGRGRPIEEPRYQLRQGPRTLMDLTRLTQNGTWEGWIEVNGRRIAVDPARHVGTRDRSWGVRSIGAPDPQPLLPAVAPQFYWLWAPLNFDDAVFYYDVNRDASGRAWHQAAFLGALGAEAEELAWAESKTTLRRGTRHAESASLEMRTRDGSEMEIRLTPRFNFYMAGIGYFHPEWSHGVYKGESALGYDCFDLAKVDESVPPFVHVQAFCGAELRSAGASKRGCGVLEQLILGDYPPLGLTGLVDPLR